MNEYFGLNHYRTPSDYINAGVIPIEPMTAKEVMDKDLDDSLHSDRYIFEEKLDGIRGLVYFMPAGKEINIPHIRVFTRRKSVKTNFYGEKTDSIPHIRDMYIPELNGTVLDCEMVVPHKDFKTVSSILNCLPQEAIERQKSEGRVVCKVFDLIYYKGVSQASAPLHERKKLLAKVFNVIHKYYRNGWLSLVPYGINHICVPMSNSLRSSLLSTTSKGSELCHCLNNKALYISPKTVAVRMTKRAYFDYIMKMGGEGIMLKDRESIYEQKRTRAYQKVKKRVYRDVVIVGFTEPTKEYAGKFPKDRWEYWESYEGEKFRDSHSSAKDLIRKGNIPLTANYFNEKIGGIVFGVVPDDLFSEHDIKTKKKFETVTVNNHPYVIVGECEGIDDEMRSDMSAHRNDWIGKVIEVEGNEMFEDTGKIRHPRFYRVREDKNASSCTWSDHVNA